MSPEVMSAVMLFVGLQGTPEAVVQIENIAKFQQRIVTAKSIRAEFTRTDINEVWKEKKVFSGQFVMRRDNDQSAWSLEESEMGHPAAKEIVVWKQCELILANHGLKTLRIYKMDKEEKADFDRRFVYPAFPLADTGAVSHNLKFQSIKSDQWYDYLLIRTKVKNRGGWCEPINTDWRAVFFRHDGNGVKAGDLRMHENSAPNDMVSRFDFTKWQIDNPDDIKNLVIDSPVVSGDWKVNRVEGVPLTWKKK